MFRFNVRRIGYILLIVLLFITGCQTQNKNSEKLQADIQDNENNTDIESQNEVIETYHDDNPIKIAFYKGSGEYKRLDYYKSKVKEMNEIGVFSIVLSNDEVVTGSSIKSLYKEISSSIPNINNYKIGFNIKFTLESGTSINENILKPSNYESYGFSPYLYAWIYDDVNANGWHSHIEEDEYNENTIMSSIKLMWGPSAKEINGNIELTVFTYDSDDFDELGNYRGVSSFTTIIEKE